MSLVPCTWCGAAPGMPCVNALGEPRGPHEIRERLAMRSTRPDAVTKAMASARTAMEDLGLEVLTAHHYTSPRGGSVDDHITIAVRLPRSASSPPDFYGVAADEVGMSVDDVLHTKTDRAVAVRRGVWLALSEAGWSSTSIGKRSASLRTWNHTTVLAGLSHVDLEDANTAAAAASTRSLLGRDSHAHVTSCHTSVTLAGAVVPMWPGASTPGVRS